MLNPYWELKPEEMSKGQRTQLKIIETAIELFGARGFSNVTLQEIAAASETSHPLILSHFKTKENLLTVVRKYVCHNNHAWVDKEISETDNGFDCIIKHCTEYVKWGYLNPSQGKIILLTHYYNTIENDEFGSVEYEKKRTLKYVLQAQREGLLKSTEAPEFVAEMIQEYTIGLFIKMLMENAGKTPNKSKFPALIKKKLTLFLNCCIKEAQSH